MNKTREKVATLQYYANRYGDFKVTYSFKKGLDTIWCKHRSVIDCSCTEEGLRFLAKANHRQILPFEIILDMDDNPTLERMNEICTNLKKNGFKYKAFFTGSKGYHIHIIDNKIATYHRLAREHYRWKLIERYGCDNMKKSDACLIAMPSFPHWRTGKMKELLDSNC